MSEKTTTEDVEEAYASVWDSFHGYQWDEELAAKFQDWLAEVERSAAAKAWGEGYQEANQDLWRDGGREGNPYGAAALGLTAGQEEGNDE